MESVAEAEIIRNLRAVRKGAMVCTPGADRMLLRAGLIRCNGKGWYDLTPAGREYPHNHTEVEHARALDALAVAVENVAASELGGEA
jgi:hypothetical protein